MSEIYHDLSKKISCNIEVENITKTFNYKLLDIITTLILIL